jgi:hypothetical protein
MRTIIGIAAALMTAGCSVVGIRSGTEEPHYTVIERLGSIEIRRYDERVAIQTTVGGSEIDARSEGFRRLAGYIFGGNRARAKIAMTAPVAQASEKIAMTAPVAQQSDGSGRWLIRFYAPTSYTVATMPEPNNTQVSIVAVPAETVAVLRFTGLALAGSVTDHTTMLLNGLKTTVWKPDGAPFTWFYDPPWTLPFLRRNEVAVAVTRNSAEH